MLVDLHPLLHQSINLFRELVGERELMFEVRSNELKTGLSSSNGLVEVEVDTVVSGRREIRYFHTLKVECALDADTLFRFKDRSNSSRKL